MSSTTEDVERQLRNIIDNLYNLMIQNFDHQGHHSNNAIINEIKRLVSNLAALTSTSGSLPIGVPHELIEYIQDGRNPDIYNREFVEKIQCENQELKGKSEAFASYTDALAKEIATGLPELKDDVQKVIGRDVAYVNGSVTE